MESDTNAGDPGKEKPITNADVHELAAGIDGATMAGINDAPASTTASQGEIATFMASAGNRIAELERLLGVAGPIAGELLTALEPGAAPLLARISVLETTLENALASPEASQIRARISALEAGFDNLASPSGTPLHSRVAQLGATLESVLTSLHSAFGGKLPSLPAPGSAIKPMAPTVPVNDTTKTN